MTNRGHEWPFRQTQAGTVEQFHQSRKKWFGCDGTKDNIGYQLASWTLPNGKRRFLRVHNIVWQTFNGPVPDGLEIDHIDGNKENNVISNLRLVTHRENLMHARARLGNWNKNRRNVTLGLHNTAT